jgi:hypothetical protein
VAALQAVADAQAERGLRRADPTVVGFWDRPYRTVSGAVPAALMAAVGDPVVASLPVGVGSIEQWVDNVDVLTAPERRASIARDWRQSLLGASIPSLARPLPEPVERDLGQGRHP